MEPPGDLRMGIDQVGLFAEVVLQIIEGFSLILMKFDEAIFA